MNKQIYSDIHPQVRHFYTFLGLHSFLIGLFPFFIPVYLWSAGYSLSFLSFFIAFTGVGFCISLYFWDRLLRLLNLQALICTSFVIECILISTFFIENKILFLFICGVTNGTYNCCFWILQRLLFLDISSPKNSGKRFGNFQIFVLVVLKIAIFTGGYLLDTYGYQAVFLLSVTMVIMSVAVFLMFGKVSGMITKIHLSVPLSVKSVWHYQDTFHSRSIFSIDGIFLFLESYFWVITLFAIVQESFWKLGILVVVLTLFFGGLFFFIKNTIDREAKQKIYFLAVILYALSWVLRGFCMEQPHPVLLLIFLVLVTFFTSFFRLALNKRFFDIAKQTGAAHEYILLKSYYSQFFLALFYAAAGFVFFEIPTSETVFRVLYFLAGAGSFLYFLYPTNERLPKA